MLIVAEPMFKDVVWPRFLSFRGVASSADERRTFRDNVASLGPNGAPPVILKPGMQRIAERGAKLAPALKSHYIGPRAPFVYRLGRQIFNLKRRVRLS